MVTIYDKIYILEYMLERYGKSYSESGKVRIQAEIDVLKESNNKKKEIENNENS